MTGHDDGRRCNQVGCKGRDGFNPDQSIAHTFICFKAQVKGALAVGIVKKAHLEGHCIIG